MFPLFMSNSHPDICLLAEALCKYLGVSFSKFKNITNKDGMLASCMWLQFHIKIKQPVLISVFGEFYYTDLT